MRRRSARADVSRNQPSAGAEPRAAGIVEGLLAAGWIITFALQYLGAHQRMLLITGKSPWLKDLALLDLTPVYALLLISTVLNVAVRLIRYREVSSGS